MYIHVTYDPFFHKHSCRIPINCGFLFITDEISKFLTLVSKLGYEDKPDYNKYKALFRDGLKRLGIKDEWKLNLPSSGPPFKVHILR